MNTDQQRIAIAEACGFADIMLPMGFHQQLSDEKSKQCGGRWRFEIPDYLNDLNAMHEAEKALPDGHTYWEFIRILDDIVKHGPHVDYVADRASATAAQRAEAFLRTIGKWTTNQQNYETRTNDC